MIKAMILLTRRPDMSHEEFVHWWLEEHVPLASGLPKVRKVILNVVEDGYDEAGIDGGVQVTGSHNPPEFNGFKTTIA